MHITITLVVTYIVCCVRIGAAPWRYWQLNARYFSSDQGIFSKLYLNTLVPEQWRLSQNIDSDALEPSAFPVFLKPEWGQNSSGIHRADNRQQLKRLRKTLRHLPQRYLLQEAAFGAREFELFSIDANHRDGKHDVITITEAVNTHERFPINSIHNRSTRYTDISCSFSAPQLARLSGYISSVGSFGISRMSVRSDSVEALLSGDFQVIEVNLFTPMPINLLDRNLSSRQRWHFIKHAMMCLARATKQLTPTKQTQPIFFRMISYGRSKGANCQRSTSRLGSSRTQSWESTR